MDSKEKDTETISSDRFDSEEREIDPERLDGDGISVQKTTEESSEASGEELREAMEDLSEIALDHASDDATCDEENAPAFDGDSSDEGTPEETEEPFTVLNANLAASVVEEKDKRPSGIKRFSLMMNRIIGMIAGGIGIICSILLIAELFVVNLKADAFAFGDGNIDVLDVLTSGFGKNALGMDNTLYFSLLLVVYIFPIFVALLAAITCFVRSLLLVLGVTRRKDTLTPPTLFTAAGIYSLIAYVVITGIVAGFCLGEGASYLLFDRALQIAVSAGLLSLLSRVLRQATVERVLKADFHSRAAVSAERPARHEVRSEPTVLRALVHRNAYFYVLFGLMAGAMIALLVRLLTMPFVPSNCEMTIREFIEVGLTKEGPMGALFTGELFENKEVIDILWGVGQAVSAFCLMVSLISIIVRIAFRAFDFLATRLAFGASAQDRYEFAKFLGGIWRRCIYLIVFAAAYAACATKLDFSSLIAAVIPYAVLMGACILLRIVYAVMVCFLRYETLEAAAKEAELAQDEYIEPTAAVEPVPVTEYEAEGIEDETADAEEETAEDSEEPEEESKISSDDLQ